LRRRGLPHQAMKNQFPMAAWRAGMDRIEAAKTVDIRFA
jgi:putative transposase